MVAIDVINTSVGAIFVGGLVYGLRERSLKAAEERYVEEVVLELQSPLPGSQGARALPVASVFEVNMHIPPGIVHRSVICST